MKSLAFLAASLALMLTLSGPRAFAADLKIMGGADGPTTVLPCGPGERIVGATFRYGHWVNYIEPYCSKVSEAGASTGDARKIGLAGGPGGDTTSNITCLNGGWITGAEASYIPQMTLNDTTGAHDFIARVRPVCTSPAGQSSLQPSPPTTNGYPYATARSDCPPGEAASAMRVVVVDGTVRGMGLTCAPIVKAVAAPPARRPSQGAADHRPPAAPAAAGSAIKPAAASRCLAVARSVIANAKTDLEMAEFMTGADKQDMIAEARRDIAAYTALADRFAGAAPISAADQDRLDKTPVGEVKAEAAGNCSRAVPLFAAPAPPPRAKVPTVAESARCLAIAKELKPMAQDDVKIAEATKGTSVFLSLRFTSSDLANYTAIEQRFASARALTPAERSRLEMLSVNDLRTYAATTCQAK